MSTKQNFLTQGGDVNLVHENERPKAGKDYAERLAKIFHEHVQYDQNGELKETSTRLRYDVSEIVKKIESLGTNDYVLLKLDDGNYMQLVNAYSGGLSYLIFNEEGTIIKTFGTQWFSKNFGNKGEKIKSRTSERLQKKGVDDSRIFTTTTKEGRGYSGGHMSQANFQTSEPGDRSDSINIDTTTSGNTSGYYPSKIYLRPKIEKAQSKINFEKISEEYGLEKYEKIQKTRKENAISFDEKPRELKPNKVVREIMGYIKNRDEIKKYIDVNNLLSEEMSIYSVESPSGEGLYVDKTLAGKMGDKYTTRTHRAEGGKVNLLLSRGFNPDYFLTNREAGWGHEKCPYMLTVSNDEATIIQELWEKGFFSDNYMEAYYEMKGLIETGTMIDKE